MIRRSTLVFLTCLAALGTSAVQTQAISSTQSRSAASQYSSSSQVLIAQASGGVASSELSVNSRGEAVKALQVRLQKSSYYGGPVDGLYGLATQRAVRAFQADTNLSQTGSLDEKTWQQLQALPNKASPAAIDSPAATDLPAASTAEKAASKTILAANSAPETAPTASELPPADASKSDAADIAEPESKAGGLGRGVGLGMGVVAVLASLGGVGFYLANRDKASEPDEGNWGQTEPSADLTANTTTTPLAPAMSQQNGIGTVSSTGSPVSSPINNGTMSQNGAAISSQGSSMVPMGQSLSTSGQMGNAAPLAQVDIIDGLVGDLRNPDPARRRKAIWELGQRGNSLAMQPLVDSMIDADSKEKSLVLAALSEIGIRSLKPMSRALAIALQDDNPEVRKNAIRDLTRVYDLVVQISQMLGHATEDEDPEVRQTATWALEQLNRIRRSQDMDANVRTFSSGSTAPPIDLLSSEASLRRSQQGLS